MTENQSQSNPVVILGMHRSGTTLLAQMLNACGVFLGNDVQGNHESRLFMQINDLLFWHCHCTWSNPLGIHLALQQDNVLAECEQWARGLLSQHLSAFYPQTTPNTGLKILQELSRPWGWKDPRNTFTLAVWRRLFSPLKAIYIVRHGIDVAQSLYQRDWHRFHQSPESYVPALTVGRDKLGLHHSRHGWTLEQAFFLWEQYLEKGNQQCDGLADRALRIRYEDLLQHPRDVMERVMEFLGMSVASIPVGIEHRVNAQRCCAYRKDPALMDFARRWERVLSEHGYEA